MPEDLIQKLDESAAAFLAEMDAGQHGSSESEGSDGDRVRGVKFHISHFTVKSL